jgi:hypothetical protein
MLLGEMWLRGRLRRGGPERGDRMNRWWQIRQRDRSTLQTEHGRFPGESDTRTTERWAQSIECGVVHLGPAGKEGRARYVRKERDNETETKQNEGADTKKKKGGIWGKGLGIGRAEAHIAGEEDPVGKINHLGANCRAGEKPLGAGLDEPCFPGCHRVVGTLNRIRRRRPYPRLVARNACVRGGPSPCTPSVTIETVRGATLRAAFAPAACSVLIGVQIAASWPPLRCVIACARRAAKKGQHRRPTHAYRAMTQLARRRT